jgi:hypothetical protein
VAKGLSLKYPHHAEGLVDPKSQKMMVSDFRYPRACRLRKYQIEISSLYQPFSKRDFYFIKCG